MNENDIDWISAVVMLQMFGAIIWVGEVNSIDVIVHSSPVMFFHTIEFETLLWISPNSAYIDVVLWAGYTGNFFFSVRLLPFWLVDDLIWFVRSYFVIYTILDITWHYPHAYTIHSDDHELNRKSTIKQTLELKVHNIFSSIFFIWSRILFDLDLFDWTQKYCLLCEIVSCLLQLAAFFATLW